MDTELEQAFSRHLSSAFARAHELEQILQTLIAITPTSARRNRLTDANIAVMEAITHLYKAEQLPAERGTS